MLKNKGFLVFIIGSAVVALVLFLFPINLFDGVVTYQDGIQEIRVEQRLSLSYFIGLGYDEADMDIVKEFHLTTKGMIMAFIFILGIPGLIGYRVHLASKK